jgi:TrpR-related protein YerC/YecD
MLKQKPIASQHFVPRNEKEKLLCKVIARIKNDTDAAQFLRDLLTPQEIEEFSRRITIAKELLSKKKSYQKIAKEMGVSTTTVTRVALWLFHGCGGYQKVLVL